MEPARSALLTDLYQLTMLQAYFDGGMDGTAVFEFFVRRLPEQRNYLIAAGLEQVLDYLETLRFDDADIDNLRRMELFGEEFLTSLAGFRFSGEVHAMPEGTAFFAEEPILQVIAPLPEAQLVESRLMNLLHYQTVVASKAARCVLAADGRTLVDFGMRRAHGAEAALYAARASYLAGFAGTATVLAEPMFGIPVFGTMAHSFIQAHASERVAFERFAASHRGTLVLLIDTYDVEAGARSAIDLARRLGDGKRVHSVRLDSGDLAADSRRVRALLDAAGCGEVGIFASGGLDEHRIAELVAAGAPIDGFGVGTALDVAEDAPTVDCVYKLQAYDGIARRKRSVGKATYPGRKQVFRELEADGRLGDDVLGLHDEALPGAPLLRPVMRDGRRLGASEDLGTIRARVADELARLPEELRRLSPTAGRRVRISPALETLTRETDARFRS